jgi:hypothetical protein
MVGLWPPPGYTQAPVQVLPVVLLDERAGDRRLTIWIGGEQAFWLVLQP